MEQSAQPDSDRDRGRARLSACLIVRDEERRLPDALASVAFCDEVVVVDSGSTDRTVAIARDAGATVVEHPWSGFGAQRNVAIDHATGDWILEVDADETITPELACEIRAFLDDPSLSGAHPLVALPMRHRFLGGWLEQSAKYPGYRYRLFRRTAYRHDEARAVHEGLVASTTVWAMRGDMTHELASTWREAREDAWRYARLEASHFQLRPTPGAVLRGALLRPAAKAVYRLVADGAWRDGWRGVVKVGIDTSVDVAVWVLAARRGAGTADRSRGHYSVQPPPGGPVRLVGLATTPAGSAAMASWLLEAAAAGADVVLLSSSADTLVPSPPRDGSLVHADRLRVVPLPSTGLFGLARALDRERQVRRIDAVVCDERGLRTRAQMVLRSVVRGARILGTTAPAATSATRLHDETRDPVPA